MTSECPHRPEDEPEPIGMYQCPECGEMVVAGMHHPDYDREFTEEDHAVIQGLACWPDNHGAECFRGGFTDVGLAVTQGRACCIGNHGAACPRSAQAEPDWTDACVEMREMFDARERDDDADLGFRHPQETSIIMVKLMTSGDRADFREYLRLMESWGRYVVLRRPPEFSSLIDIRDAIAWAEGRACCIWDRPPADRT